MDLALNDDQAALIETLTKILDQHGPAILEAERASFSRRLDEAIEQAGFFDETTYVDFGDVVPTLIVEAVASQPQIVEVASSAFVRPSVCPNWPRPLAVITGAIDRPARFLCESKSVLFVGEHEARISDLSGHERQALDPFFAYPMGRLANPTRCFAQSSVVASADDVRKLLLLAVAGELAATLQGALDSVLEHVKTRRQFGRPLGSFQAVQHRLAGNAANIGAGRWLTRKAAALRDAQDILIAAAYLQDCATQILYDLHQFMGAMGLTLEHPLYRWSYRAKLLKSELGGASKQMRDLATIAWPEEAAARSQARDK